MPVYNIKNRHFMLAVLTLTLTTGVLLANHEQPLYTPETTVGLFAPAARTIDGLVQLRWQTTLELGIDAFFVQRQRNGGTPEPVGSGYVRTHGNEDGESYELADPLVQAGDSVRYDLFSLSRHGRQQLVATWTGIVRTAPPPPKTMVPSVAASSAPAVPLALAQPWIGAIGRVLSWTNSVPADRVRLSLKEEGLYRVSAQEIADASGWPVANVTAAIASTNLNMSCQGAPVAWYADGTNLLFHGIPAASRFAPENVYWITQSPGSHMTHQVITPETPATTNQWFYNQITRQGTNYLTIVTKVSQTNSPMLFIAFDIFDINNSKNYNTSLISCATGIWSGTTTINLMSCYETDANDIHTARISLGGQTLGEPCWTNEQYVSFEYPFSSVNMTGGPAVLEVANMASIVNAKYRFFFMSYSLSYACLYRAQDNALRCTGGTNNTVSISGFASNDVVVLDVTVTNAPVVIEPVTITYNSVVSNWAAAFPCGGTGQLYQVFSKSAGTRQPAVRGVRDVDWSSPTNTADYVILIPPEGWCAGFRQAMQPLADYRNAQGLRTMIVDVESLYNRYSYGLVDPLAIQSFCRAGYTNWLSHPLRYVLLAGAGALDFKHQRYSVNDSPTCLIPTLTVGQSYLNGLAIVAAIDAAFGDVNGDDIPEIAVGRLPTTKTQELSIVVQKTIVYETEQRWKQSVSIAPDCDYTGDKYYQFSVGTDQLIGPLVMAKRNIIKHYPIDNSGNLAPIRVYSLFPALLSGASLFHFFGHSNELNLGGGDGKLLTSPADISSANWQKPMIAVFIGCLPNRWHGLSATTTNCIAPYGLFAANTGFVAVLGATGYMLASEGETLAVNMYENGGISGTWRLGDIWQRGLKRSITGASRDKRTRLLSYSLIGDPTLVFYYTPSPTLIFMIR